MVTSSKRTFDPNRMDTPLTEIIVVVRCSLFVWLAERAIKQALGLLLKRDGFGRREAGGAAGGPGPEEVVAADRAERVEHLAAQEEARRGVRLSIVRGSTSARLDAAAGDLGLLVALVARSTAARRAPATR